MHRIGMRRAALLASLVLAALAALGPVQGKGQQQGQGQAPIQELPAFSALQVCVPFNVLVSPSNASAGGPAFGLQVEAAADVASAISGNVTGDTLQLQTAAFTTQQPIKVVVYLPADRLTAIDHLGSLSSVYVREGFNVDSFKLRMGSGGGSAYVYNMTANSLSLQTQSTGDVVLTGTFGSADIATSGISEVYMAGVTQAVGVDLSGISNLLLEPASSTVRITGRAAGISTVLYTQGQCSVQSAFLLSSPCQQTSAVSLQAPTPTWTQGLTAVGSFTCGPGKCGRSSASFLAASSQPQLFNLQFPGFQLISPFVPVPQAPTPTTPAPAPMPAPTPLPAPAPVPTPPGRVPTPPSVGGIGPQFVAAPAPSAELEAPNPYAFTVQSPAGAQFQAGSVTDQSRTAQSAATGQRQASATSIAGPQGVSTRTSNDDVGIAAGTTG